MPLPPSLIVCTPSRGLIHSRTVQAVQAAVARAVDTEVARLCAPVGWWKVTHGLPIPACHEQLAEHAVCDVGADLLWFVEEDMVPTHDALTLLIDRQRATGAGVVTLDYPVGEHPTHSCVTHRAATGDVWWGGLGCTLITAQTLHRLPRPWMRSDRTFLRRGDTLQPSDAHARYGGHDVAFYLAAHAAGIPVAEVPAEESICGHARLRALGQPQTNDGAHSIDVLTEIQERH